MGKYWSYLWKDLISINNNNETTNKQNPKPVKQNKTNNHQKNPNKLWMQPSHQNKTSLKNPLV